MIKSVGEANVEFAGIEIKLMERECKLARRKNPDNPLRIAGPHYAENSPSASINLLVECA